MRKLILASGLLAAAFIGGPQAAVAQNEFAYCVAAPIGDLNCIYNNLQQCRVDGGSEGSCVPNPARTARVQPLPPPGGGEYLPPAQR
jgi:hypothetical protein